jgi:hypothetical protein
MRDIQQVGITAYNRAYSKPNKQFTLSFKQQFGPAYYQVYTQYTLYTLYTLYTVYMCICIPCMHIHFSVHLNVCVSVVWFHKVPDDAWHAYVRDSETLLCMCTYTCILHLLETLPVSVYSSRTDHHTSCNTSLCMPHIHTTGSSSH